MLDEVVKNSPSLTQKEKKDVSVEVQNLTCYWDKVRHFADAVQGMSTLG